MRLMLAILVSGCGTSTTSAESPGTCRECSTEEAREVPGCEAPVGEAFPCEGQCHVDDASTLEWATNPPASGDHLPVWERQWGEHAEAVNRANWVHNLEHGAIVLLYNCPQACDAGLGVLREVLVERPDQPILLTPDPLLDPPRFAAVSWTWIYETDDPDLATLLCFVDQHACQSPEGVRMYGEECLL